MNFKICFSFFTFTFIVLLNMWISMLHADITIVGDQNFATLTSHGDLRFALLVTVPIAGLILVLFKNIFYFMDDIVKAPFGAKGLSYLVISFFVSSAFSIFIFDYLPIYSIGFFELIYGIGVVLLFFIIGRIVYLRNHPEWTSPKTL